MTTLFIFFLIFSFLILILFCVVTVISYFAMNRMVVPSDHMRNGGHRVALLEKVRPKLLSRDDISEVEFKTFDNLKLNGLFIKRENPKGNLLLCHGIHSIKEFMYLFLDILTDYNVLMFDFRAHGKSEGDLITIGFNESRDVICAAKYLKELSKNNGNKELPLVATGFSMGGSSVLQAVEQDPTICDAIIADSAFKSLKEIVYDSFHIRARGLPRFPFFYFTKWVFYFVSKVSLDSVSPIKSVKKINKPILFIHSLDDHVVPNKDSVSMFEYSIHNKSRLWIGPNCQHARLHNNYFYAYKNKVLKFLNDALN